MKLLDSGFGEAVSWPLGSPALSLLEFYFEVMSRTVPLQKRSSSMEVLKARIKMEGQ
jgi:hypothetical protein